MNPKGNPANLRPFKPGQSGNPGGKPVGARNELNAAFLRALAADFEACGIEAIEACRINSPEIYVGILARLLPKEVEHRADEGLLDVLKRLADKRAGRLPGEPLAVRDGDAAGDAGGLAGQSPAGKC